MRKGVIVGFLLLLVTSLFSNAPKNEYHFQMDEGKIIYALQNGQIISYGFDIDRGNYIEIDYPSLSMIVRYCHLESFNYFNNNVINKGDRIGKSGYSGKIDEPELSLIVTIKESFIDIAEEKKSDK